MHSNAHWSCMKVTGFMPDLPRTGLGPSDITINSVMWEKAGSFRYDMLPLWLKLIWYETKNDTKLTLSNQCNPWAGQAKTWSLRHAIHRWLGTWPRCACVRVLFVRDVSRACGCQMCVTPIFIWTYNALINRWMISTLSASRSAHWQVRS